MYKPQLRINLRKLRENAAAEKAMLARHGVEVMGVNKVFDGCVETARALVEGGIEVIAESRTYNLARIRQTGCITCLLRSPCMSEVADVVRHADVSLNSEPRVVRALSAEAVRQNRNHSILLMVDMGDLREGIWFEHEDRIIELARMVRDLPGLSLYGMGTNFNCYGTVMPSVKNGKDFHALVQRVEAALDIRVPRLSAGNCTSYHLIDKGQWPAGLNHLRIGGLHQFGIEYVDMKYVDGLHHSNKPVGRACSDLYVLRAEVIEASAKPTVPVGELGVDAFLQPKHFEDHGTRRRVLLAFGRQDVPVENCTPLDDAMQVLGQTSDHTLIDVEDCGREYAPGDTIDFELDYTALLMASQTGGVEKVFITD